MNADIAQEYEIIDAHTHIFPQKIAVKASEAIGDFYDLPMCSDGSSERLLSSAREAGVSRCLVFSTATAPQQTQSINTFIAQECSAHPEFLGLGTLHPQTEDMEGEISRIEALGLRGIKLHPDFQRFDIDDPAAFPMYSMLEGKLPVLIHMGDDRYDYSRPHKLVRVLENFPKLRVIAAHLGGYRRWQEAEELLCRRNIKVDTSSSLAFLEPAYTQRLIRRYGAENVFFGTDFPMWDYASELERFFAIGLTRSENEQILSKNFRTYFQ